MTKTSHKTKLIVCVVAAAILIIFLELALSKTKTGIDPYEGNDTYATYGFQVESADYKTVKLAEVINNSDISKNNHVRTQGIVVGAEYGEYGGDILLTDGSGNYLLVAICHACIHYFAGIMPSVKRGVAIEIAGIASFTAPPELDLEQKFNLPEKLPERIGMIGINELRVIK